MNPDTLARLRKEAEQPAGVAPVIDSPELAQLLEERDALMRFASEVAGWDDDDCADVLAGLVARDLAQTALRSASK